MSLNPTNLYIQAAPLPATFRGNPNDLFVEMVKRMRILSPSGTNFIFIGDTEPTSNVGPWLKGGNQWYVWDEATKRYVPQNISASFTSPYFIGKVVPSGTTPNLWLQTTLGGPANYGDPLRWFSWNGAAWVWPHDIAPNSGDRRMWVGSESDLWFYDGGDGTDPAAATDTKGAMWAIDTIFNSKSPRGAVVGTLDPAASGGADVSTITIPAYLPSHNHGETTVYPPSGDGYHNNGQGSTVRASDAHTPGGAGTSATAFSGNTDLAGGGVLPTVDVPIIPSCVGTFFIKRSARKFYTPA